MSEQLEVIKAVLDEKFKQIELRFDKLEHNQSSMLERMRTQELQHLELRTEVTALVALQSSVKDLADRQETSNARLKVVEKVQAISSSSLFVVFCSVVGVIVKMALETK